MTHIYKAFIILIFVAAAVSCSQNGKQLQPIAKQSQADKNHNLQVNFSFETGSSQASRISGFRLYQDGRLICENHDPKSERIECNISSPHGSFLFTLTAYYEDGSESKHSDPFSYTIPE